MNSIRIRLFVILLFTTGLVWLSAIAWIYVSTEAQVEKVLDARLREAARMVDSLITDQRIDVASAISAATNRKESFRVAGEPYEHQLSCQIWSLGGKLVGQSGSAPLRPLSEHRDGFQETVVDGSEWRVYAVVNEKLGVRVLVGDSLAVRQKLVDNVIKGLILPAALILPVLASLIWVSVGRGLAPLRRLAAGLATRGAEDLRPVETQGSVSELRPVSGALNGLFERLSASRERERNFTAFAAHELKTPLAGLRTQAQVALASRDDGVRDRALNRIIQGVDRTGRLVRQLLDLTEIEGGREARHQEPAALTTLLAELLEELAVAATRQRVAVVLPEEKSGATIQDGQTLLKLALRNVLENAIQYAPEETTVQLDIVETQEEICLRVEDEGPGMSDEDMRRATERFFRASDASGSGSGLGLSIAQASLKRLGGHLHLERAKDGNGLVAILQFAKSTSVLHP